MSIPEATGDCYEAALNYLMDHRDELHLRLVHAEVAGQGPLEGITLGHAWVEDGGWVIDRSNGRNIRMPKWQYYAIGKVLEINNIHRYTFQQAAETCLKYGHYGPWVDSLMNTAL
ncbi:gp61 [Mycobacterium phage Barnyard]|uniref:Uncharacterized protein n=1 Tax=Mycobacterium phage Barnyard TaxID=205880 RepID=Q856B1_9CAUD|nr:gp61 [Mycobacterium phage Barnyard]AAN02115.1 hypothetical protein PBI_BARNYARD_61 [Mycobacterium phage Barnyard]